jgi:3-oxoacyl-[acyl-carrier-protein] synthase-3
MSPATSVVVQHRLGARNAGTFDLNRACAGFVTALDTASKFIIADDSYKKVLVIGAYAMSKYLDWKDKKTATIFADGAGAVVLEASETGPGFL